MAATEKGPEDDPSAGLDSLWASLANVGKDAARGELDATMDVLSDAGIIERVGRETDRRFLYPDAELINPLPRFYVTCEPPLQIEDGVVVETDDDDDLIRNAYYIDVVWESDGADDATIETRASRVFVGTADAEYDDPSATYGQNLLGVVTREVARLSILRANGLALAPDLHPDFTERT